uniref:Major facilitator superfamily (MFS) profile domain-containing protein n=1 Tax=Gossypium raimondii TaxID=29730 RepID=A0A0D2NMN7_GOSRA|nr:hypothetical protein B456_002G134100 [Gossypium raimondii]
MEMVKQDNRRQLSARILMRFEQDQKETEDACRFVEQNAATQRYSVEVLQITNYFIFACLVAAIGDLFLDMILVFLLLTLFTSSLYFAGLFLHGASYVTRNKGRRASILVGAVSFFLGGAINAGAVNITMLIIGCILLDAGI